MKISRGKYMSSRTGCTKASLAWIVCITLLASLLMPSLGACTTGQKPSEPINRPNTSAATTPESYNDLYEAIMATAENNYSAYSGSGLVMEDSVAEVAPLAESTDSGAKESSASGNSGSQNYSETNVQVAGIDEGDIVKTDGEYIYIISNTDVIIAEAAGSDTKEIARIKLDAQLLGKTDGENYDIYAQDLYVANGVLVVLYQYYPEYIAFSDSKIADSIYYPLYYQQVTEVALFDVSTIENPVYIKSFGQDGNLATSRLQDGILYVVSNYWIYDTENLDPDHPETYVPRNYTDDTADLAASADICILPDYYSNSYTIVNSIDLTNSTRVDQQSIYGATGSVYMSYDNLYIGTSVYDKTELNSYQDGSFTVTEYREGYSTRISKLALNDGNIEFVTDVLVEGSLLNQFSLDEYNGNLRLVTTIDKSEYRSIADSEGEMVDYNSYVYADSTNSLFVLDESLQTIGSIEGLASDERVYSVRFDGEVGYFVTFRQVDPLFAVDLSDPTNPTIKSELKIPGFSTYMHVFSEDRLFGLGMAADEDGRTTGLKMSMFDTSDPYNITEKHKLELENYYSEALYNHKAIIIDQSQNLIGFPTDSGYLIYGYSDEEGFYLRAELQTQTDDYYYYYSQARGLYIEDCFYICAGTGVEVYTLDTFEPIASIAFEIEEPDYGIAIPYAAEEIE